MAEHLQFRYTQKITASGFSRALSESVDSYFLERRVSRHANAEMLGKTVLGFALWIGSYLWLLSDRFTPLEIVGVYVIHGFTQLFIAFNIAHDANHGAYSRSARVNRVLGCVFDLVGVSSYMWRLLHNDSHHSFVNIRGADTTLITGQLFRFSPHDKRRWFHRYQHLYASFVYSLSTLDWVLLKDYRWLFTQYQFGNRRTFAHPPSELALLLAGKAFYYTYTLVIPLLYLSVPWYSVLLGFLVMHLCIGFTIALIFQPNHFNEDSTYPEADDEGRIANNYISHVFDTTLDYARGNPIAIWFLGGLNLHIIHHMFPGICHVYYTDLTRIVKATAEDYDLRYRECRTITGAYLAHLRWLKVLGTVDDVSTAQDSYGAEQAGFGAPAS